MRMIQKLKALEKAVVFLRWATDAEFGKIKYVGDDRYGLYGVHRERPYQLAAYP